VSGPLFDSGTLTLNAWTGGFGWVQTSKAPCNTRAHMQACTNGHAHICKYTPTIAPHARLPHLCVHDARQHVSHQAPLICAAQALPQDQGTVLGQGLQAGSRGGGCWLAIELKGIKGEA